MRLRIYVFNSDFVDILAVRILMCAFVNKSQIRKHSIFHDRDTILFFSSFERRKKALLINFYAQNLLYVSCVLICFRTYLRLRFGTFSIEQVSLSLTLDCDVACHISTISELFESVRCYSVCTRNARDSFVYARTNELFK